MSELCNKSPQEMWNEVMDDLGALYSRRAHQALVSSEPYPEDLDELLKAVERIGDPEQALVLPEPMIIELAPEPGRILDNLLGLYERGALDDVAGLLELTYGRA